MRVADPLRPDRGIAPGCALATTLAKIYMQPLQRWMARHPKVTLDAYINDFQIVVLGSRINVMQWAADALIDLDRGNRDEIKCTLHEEKACITATDSLLAHAIIRLVGVRIGGPQKGHAESLGIDLQVGRKRKLWGSTPSNGPGWRR